MSTKTIFKRIALVVASALGLSVFAVVTPANAAITESFSTNVSSVTVIADSSTYDTSNAVGAIFKIVLRNQGTTKTNQSLQSGEALTASVVGVPAGTGATEKVLTTHDNDLTLNRVTPSDTDTIAGNPYIATSMSGWTIQETSSTSIAGFDTSTVNSLEFSPGDPLTTETLATGGFTNSYYLRVVPTKGATVKDQGEYTIRLRLTSGSGSILVQDTLLKVRFVTTAIGAGFTLTASNVGTFAIGETTTAYSSTKYARAVLADANGGRVVSETTAGTTAPPVLAVDVIDTSDNTDVSASTDPTSHDDGGERDFGYAASTVTGYAQNNANIKNNNTYGIIFPTGSLDSVTAGTTGDEYAVRVRFGDKTATTVLSIINTRSSGTASASVIADGLSYDSAAPNWYVPLTTKSVDLYVSGAGAGNTVIFTPTWTNFASGDVSPTSATAKSVVADSSGVAKLTLTNSSPVHGAYVTVAISGFLANPASQVITWNGNIAYTQSVDLDGAIVKTGTTNTWTTTVTDRFGAPVAGVVLKPSLGTTSANYSATTTYASITTDASGQASFTLTDAAAAADDFDAVTFTHIAASGAISAATSTITYAAAAPAPTALTTFYYESYTAGTVATVVNPVPSTGIYKSGTTGTTKFSVVTARNNTRTIATSDVDLLTIRVRAAEGAAVTATTSTGFIRNAAGLPVTSSTKYGNSTGDVYFHLGSTKTGANTVTFTSGSVTASASWWVGNATADARFVTLTGPATGTSNGDLGNYTVKVTDRFGNGVSGASLSISAGGVAAFGGGATLQTFTTGSSGEFTFTGTSFNSDGGAGSFTATMTNSGTDATSVAGFVGTTAVEGTLAAGNSSATLSVTYAAGQSAAAQAAEAASDAALEAIDAANAATDAANLAAEAADAATVAAEEARDAADAATAAVEALASEVATLMAALKAQITTLAKTVAKIAKKVKA